MNILSIKQLSSGHALASVKTVDGDNLKFFVIHFADGKHIPESLEQPDVNVLIDRSFSREQASVGAAWARRNLTQAHEDYKFTELAARAQLALTSSN